MKITSEHRAVIKDYIRTYMNKYSLTLGKIVNDYKMHNMSERRMCNDLTYASGMTQWICDTIYQYANDDHLYTVMRHVVRELMKEEEVES